MVGVAPVPVTVLSGFIKLFELLVFGQYGKMILWLPLSSGQTLHTQIISFKFIANFKE